MRERRIEVSSFGVVYADVPAPKEDLLPRSNSGDVEVVGHIPPQSNGVPYPEPGMRRPWLNGLAPQGQSALANFEFRLPSKRGDGLV